MPDQFRNLGRPIWRAGALSAVLLLAACGSESGSSSAPSPGSEATGGAAAGPDSAAAAAAYAPCAACHLPTGMGVPGAFPPIRNRAAAIARLDGGREYLIAVVAHGLMGQISVEGQNYMGVMPGHAGSMDDAQIAAAVNHTIFALSDSRPEDIPPVDANEVQALRSSVASPSPTSTMQRREALVAQHGQAWP